MRKMYIKPVDKLYNLDSNITIINMESSKLFRMVSMDIYNNIILSVNDVPEDIEKKALILYNPFEININENKFIKMLYKKLEYKIKTTYDDKIINIESKLFSLLDSLELDSLYPLDYNMNIDVQKLLSAIGILYKNPETYIEKLIYYIRLTKDLNNISFIISFGLCNLLEDIEVKILNKELKELSISLIDINYINKFINKSILIDEDWCII